MGERRRSTGSFDARRTTGSNEVVDRLFVYATLLHGQSARSLIAHQITKCVEASTTGTLYVFPMGYGGFLEADEPKRVVGELLWLSDLPAAFGLLDAYEGTDFAEWLSARGITAFVLKYRLLPTPVNLAEMFSPNRSESVTRFVEFRYAAYLSCSAAEAVLNRNTPVNGTAQQ